MMRWTAWTLWCLLLFGAENAGCVQDGQCSPGSAGSGHPVKGYLERFDVGLGCAARESGPQETHVITIARASRSPNQQVTVLLRPLSYSKPSSRPVLLVLSSQNAVRWSLETDGPPLVAPVMALMSPNSSVESESVVGMRWQLEEGLPWRPRALLHWSLHRYGTISSLTHASHANRVYIRLGEDSTLSRECHLQPLFLSRNYLTSDVQPQEVQGCLLPGAESDPEVHVIKLWSAGSGLCGSLQVEVTVSIVPPVASRGSHKLVLILSSAAPVNWAVSAAGIQGQIFVYASNSVTPLYPARPDLTMTSTLSYDLLSTANLLDWANQNGFPRVTSYTEADLANRFVIRLTGGGTERSVRVPIRPPWVGQPRVGSGPWSTGDGEAETAVSVRCLDGQLVVAVDKHTLQALSLPLAAVTLRDPSCQARSNGSHFLLAFPVISCGTEGLMEGSSPTFQYKNTVLLWRQALPAPTSNDTEQEWSREQPPVAIHFSCEAPAPSLGRQAVVPPAPAPAPAPAPGERSPVGRGGSRSPWSPGRLLPVYTMQLFVTEHYEKRQTGPCVITAQNRVYVQISAEGAFKGSAEVQSCVVSPHSDPRRLPNWPVILEGCSRDPSVLLTPLRKKKRKKGMEDEDIPGEEEEEQMKRHIEEEEEEEEERDTEEREDEEEEEDVVGRTWAASQSLAGQTVRKTKKSKRGVTSAGRAEDGGREVNTSHLRFSFVLQPVFNNSIHFLHCSLRLCSPAAHISTTQTTADASGEESRCQKGVTIPALLKAQLPTQKCEYRNLSRPMLVTSPMKLAKHLAPPAAPRHIKGNGNEVAVPKPLRTGLPGNEIEKPRVLEPPRPSPLQSASGVGTGPVLGIVFTAFLMGICLMGALWCVYTRTGKRGDEQQGLSNMSGGAWNSAALMEQLSNTAV
ncbi:transforming growth factor beta receptor type 3 [Engraulis encrasicolus]|uniref:transforming growth factor beta receptor type 3 n=1 Tax=Engraulis encrasicolus TaxID=184585 RepID=UPI002FD6D027